jgi:hypothetical protein
VANPGSDELSGDAVLWKASKFAKLIELAASDDVKRVWDGEAVADVFVPDVELFHMVVGIWLPTVRRRCISLT